MFYIYIIYSNKADIYYKGFTTTIENRIAQHNTSKSEFTSRNSDWVLVYSKLYETKKEVLIEEKRLKKLNRKSLEKLIKVKNT